MFSITAQNRAPIGIDVALPAEMPRYKCSYHRCKKTSEEQWVFKLPINDKDDLLLWIKNSGNKALSILPEDKLRSKVICAAHFCPKCIHRSGKETSLIGHAAPIPYDKSFRILDDGHLDTCNCIRVLKVAATPKVYGNRKRTTQEIQGPSSVSYGYQSSSDYQMLDPFLNLKIKREYTAQCMSDLIEQVHVKEEVSVEFERDFIEDETHQNLSETPNAQYMSIDDCSNYKRAPDAVEPVNVKKELPVEFEVDLYETKETTQQSLSDNIISKCISTNDYSNIRSAMPDKVKPVVLKKKSRLKLKGGFFETEGKNSTNDCLNNESSFVTNAIKSVPLKSLEVNLFETKETHQILSDISTSQSISTQSSTISTPATINKEKFAVKEELDIIFEEDPVENEKATLQDVDIDLFKTKDTHKTSQTKHCSTNGTPATIKKEKFVVKEEIDIIFEEDSEKNEKASLQDVEMKTDKTPDPDKNLAKRLCCSVCCKNFKVKPELVEHMNKFHIGNKTFTCKRCDAVFVRKSDWTKHVRQNHTGDKPYTCNTCDKKFTHKNHLRDHINRIHSRERPYPCNMCKKAFYTRYSMNRHAQTHLRKRYSCKTCDVSFAKESTLIKHYSRHGFVITQKKADLSLVRGSATQRH